MTLSKPENTSKRERLEARLTAEQKMLLQRAAALQGSSLSDFVVSEALQAAEQIIRAHTVIALDANASRQFVAALLNAPEPNDRLQQAAQRYRRLTEEPPA